METICLRFSGKEILCPVYPYVQSPWQGRVSQVSAEKIGPLELTLPQAPGRVGRAVCSEGHTGRVPGWRERVRLVITCIEPAADIYIKTARLFFNFNNMLIHLPGLRRALTAALGLLCAYTRRALRTHITMRGFLTAVTSLRAEHGC